MKSLAAHHMFGTPSAVLAVANDALPLIQPALLIVLCIVSALGMILLLPGRKEKPIRVLGAIALLAVLLILTALLAKRAAGVGAYFWIFSAIAIIGAVRVITHTKPVYSALYFVLTVMASAGLFVLMSADFMAAALVLIYAGAILVTYVFVIMLASEAAPASARAGETEAVYGLADHDAVSREPVAASAIGFALLGVMLFVVFDRAGTVERAGDRVKPQTAVVENTTSTNAPAAFVPKGQTQRLGVYLFEKQLVNLELAGLILTVAMVGAIMIARRKIVKLDEEPPMPGEVITGPATPVDDDPHSIPVFGTENPRQKAYPET